MSAIRLLLPRGSTRRWHAALVDRLARDGHSVDVELRDARPAPPPALVLVERLERLLYRRGRADACDDAPPGDWAHGLDGRAVDFVFDLTGAAETQRGAIAPLYDAVAGDLARDAALLNGRAPQITLATRGADQWTVLAQALPALERPRILLYGRTAVADRVMTLVRGLAGHGAGAFTAQADSPRLVHRNPLAYFAGGIVEAARRKLIGLLAHEGHWRIGWRALAGGDSVLAALAWPEGAPWRWLPDDRRRYFADPFPFEEGGRTYVFCEEYPYATQKGVISVFTLDASGQTSAPRVVLERPYHLSYPLVFRHAGQIWMTPESSGNRTLDLYRADRFPDRWVLERVLIADVEISDATPFEHAGRWWMTAATNEPGSSTWDCLSLFSGAAPIGPWTRAGDRPVLIDASAARPAGRIVRHGGALWRPAQDCTRGYGSGLALCRIDELGEGAFRQTVVQRLAPPVGAPSAGVHTLNSCERFEVIDAVGRRAHSAWLGQGNAT